MKRPLLERAQRRFLRITPRPLRKDKHGLPLPPHLLRRLLKRLERILPITAIDEHGPAERHEPAQEGNEFKGGFGGDAAVGREDGAEEEDVEFGLVVADYDAGAGVKVFGAGDDGEADTGGDTHDMVEGAGGEVLGKAVVATEAEDEGNDNAVGSAEKEGEVGG